VDPLRELRRWHGALYERNVAVEIVGPSDDLAAYAVVVLPCQYLLDDAAIASITAYVHGGGAVVATYFSGIVDEHDHIRLGGYPGALRELLGIRIEEFFPLAEGDCVPLSVFGTARVWTELGRVTEATELASYVTGPVAGSPAVTRREVGPGRAWYVGTVLDDVGTVLDRVLADASVRRVVTGLPRGVEAVRRVAADGTRYLFVVNHTEQPVDVPVSGTDLITGAAAGWVAAGGVAVIRQG
jgi:beta-galactosidase